MGKMDASSTSFKERPVTRIFDKGHDRMKIMIDDMKSRIPARMHHDDVKINPMQQKQIAIIPIERNACTLYIYACKINDKTFIIQFMFAVKSGTKLTDGTFAMQRVDAKDLNVIANDEMYDAMKISNALDHAFNIQLSWKIFTASFAKSLF